MTDPTSLSVLADAAAWMLVALLLGAGAYKAMRSLRPGLGWSERGQVEVAAFRAVDACLVLALAWLIWANLNSLAHDAPGQGAEAVAAQTVEETEERVPSAVDALANVLFLLLICMALLFYLRQVRGLDPAQLFGLRRLSLARVLGVSILALLVAVPCTLASSMVFTDWLKEYWPDLKPQDAVQMFAESSRLADKLVMAVAAVIVAPLVEELVFRGFVYGVVKRHTDAFFAAIVSSALFALAHFHLGSALPLFVLALGFTLAYERTGSLLVPMLMHALFNGVTLAVLLIFGPQL